MDNKNSDIKKVISVGDIFAVVIIVIGLVIAIFLEEIAFRMIGVSVSILGAVALFMSISQKMQSVIAQPKFNAPKPETEFKVTVKKDTSATRKTVEDFSETFKADEEIFKPQNTLEHENEEDLGFKIVKKTVDNNLINEEKSEISSLIQNTEEKVETMKVDDKFTFEDGMSGVKIIKKFKVDNIEEKVVQNPEQVLKIEENITKIERESKSNIEEDIVDNLDIAACNSDLPNVIPGSQVELTFNDSKPIKSFNEEVKPKTQVIEPEKPKINNYKEKKIDLPLNTLIESDPLIGDEPRKEFEYFLSKILMIIRSITNTRTACFMLLSGDYKELILESYVTNIPDYITNKPRIPIANDILSQIITTGKPEILTEINPMAELDLLPYYKVKTGTVSFIGVPVFYKDAPIGVLCADSDTYDAYDSLTVGFLGHFTKLIAALVQSYTRKFDLLQTAKTLETISLFNSIALRSKTGNENLAQSIVDSVAKIFEHKTIGVVGFNNEKAYWEIKAINPHNDRLIGLKLDIANSLIGSTINQGNPLYLPASELKNHIRVYKDEPAFSGDSFVCVPIVSNSGVYGAIYIETKIGYNFTDFDINILEIIGEQAGNAVERLQLIELFNISMLNDIRLGILNSQALYNRAQEEFYRFADFGTQITFAMITLDRYNSIDREKYPHRYEIAFQNCVNKLKKHLRPYDIIGQISDNVIGVVIVGRDANNTRFAFETFRNEVANSVIKIDNSKLNITVSVGIYAPNKKDKFENMVENTEIALNKSIAKANSITIFA